MQLWLCGQGGKGPCLELTTTKISAKPTKSVGQTLVETHLVSSWRELRANRLI